MFLDLAAIKMFHQQLKGWLIKTVVSDRVDKSLYYLLEPIKGIVHIIQGEQEAMALAKSLSENGNFPEMLIKEKLYKKIPSRGITTWGLTLERGKYKHIQNHGTQKKLVARYIMGIDKVAFNLVPFDGEGNNIYDIEYPENLKVGDKETRRADSLVVILSKQSQRDFIDRAGVFIDEELRSKLEASLAKAFDLVRQDLSPYLLEGVNNGLLA